MSSKNKFAQCTRVGCYNCKAYKLEFIGDRSYGINGLGVIWFIKVRVYIDYFVYMGNLSL